MIKPSRNPAMFFRSVANRLFTATPAYISLYKALYSPCHHIQNRGFAINAFKSKPSYDNVRRRQSPPTRRPDPHTQEDLDREPTVDEIAKAKNSALWYISRSPYSRKELETKLLDKGVHLPKSITAALDRLEDIGLHSDNEFAHTYARSKFRQSKWAAPRIKTELKRKGIAPDITEEAIQSVFGEDGLNMRQHFERLEEDEHPSLPDDDNDKEQSTLQLISSSVSINTNNNNDYNNNDNIAPIGGYPEAALLEDARRRWGGVLRGLPIEAKRRRLIGYLQRRGHKWEDVSRILNFLQNKVEDEE
jgi:SOS response regulatory protein OraA/RecX